MRRAAFLIMLLALTACASAAPSMPSPPARESRLAATPATPARWRGAQWRLRDPETPDAQVAITGGVLQVGDGGRRWLVRADGSVQEAVTVAPDALVDVRTRGSSFEGMAKDGAVYTFDEPLGPLVRSAPRPPTSDVVAFRLGKSALLGVTSRGDVWRAPSASSPWTRSRLPLVAGERVVAFDTDRAGHALVLVDPQRLILSTDDAATFAETPVRGMGPTKVVRDGDSRLWVLGAVTNARLEGDALRSGGAPVPLQSVPTPTASSVSRYDVLAGDRLATLTRSCGDLERCRIALALGPLEGPPGPSHTMADSVVRERAMSMRGGLVIEPFRAERDELDGWSTSSDVRVDGHAQTVVVARRQTDPRVRLELLETSEDDGTFSTIGSFEGEPGRFAVFAGPHGWVLLGRDCASRTCRRLDLRAGGVWRRVGNGESLGLPAWDEGRGRVYLANQDRDTIQSLDVASAKLDTLPVATDRLVMAMTVDEAGTLSVVSIVQGSPWHLTRYTPGSAAGVTVDLPFVHESHDAAGVAFAGRRGFAVAGLAAYETLDSGAHWTRVAAPTSARREGGGTEDFSWMPLACSSVGCVTPRRVRVGWDLPAPAGDERAESPPADETPPGPPPPPSPVVTISCVVESASTRLSDGAIDAEPAFGGATLWLEEDDPYSRHPWVSRDGGVPRRLSLLGPLVTRPGRTTRSWSSESGRGVVTADFRYDPNTPRGKYASVAAELRWYDANSGEVGRASLAHVKPFRPGPNLDPSASSFRDPSPYPLGGMIDIVDGGLLVLPENPEASLYFAHTGGTVDVLTRPPPSRVQHGSSEAVKVGGWLAVVGRTAWPEVKDVAVTSDLGTSWRRATWSAGESASLDVVGERAALSVWRDGRVLARLSLEAIEQDLPPWRAIASTAPEPLAECAASSLADRSTFERIEGGVRIDVASTPVADAVVLERATRYARVAADGTACTAVLRATDGDVAGHAVEAVVSPHDLAHGQLVRRVGEHFYWSALHCAVRYRRAGSVEVSAGRVALPHGAGFARYRARPAGAPLNMASSPDPTNGHASRSSVVGSSATR